MMRIEPEFTEALMELVDKQKREIEAFRQEIAYLEACIRELTTQEDNTSN